MTKRWTEIDAMYAIGIILVIAGHSHSSDWSAFDGTALQRAIVFIYTFHMPLFFFVAGFLFQNSDRLEREGFQKWIAEKAMRLLTPYIFWSLLAAVPKYYVEMGTLTGLGQSLLSGLICPRLGVWGHLWFLPTIFLVYLICSATKALLKDEGLLALLITSLMLYFLPIKTQVLGMSDIAATLVFFALGMLARKHVYVLPRGGALSAAALVAGVGASLPLHFMSSKAAGFLVALMMIFTCWNAATLMGDSPLIRWLSEHNFTTYLFSWFFQSVAMVVCSRFSLEWQPTFALMFCAGLAGPATVIAIYSQFPALHTQAVRLVLGIR